MCGITGYLNLDNTPASRVFIRKMADVMAHRGPDGEGFYSDGPVSLGHRRLAIIDLTPAGHQPMTSPDNRFVISYNGEIYNFRELRVELEGLGRKFHSGSDTEVVLNAYMEWGPEAVERLNGMFAFAVWDKAEKELFLARDRYGIKPLYYSLKDKVFVFASEQKALIQHPDVGRGLDREALLEYFTFQNLFTDRTFFREIKTFPAGSWAKVSAKTRGLEPRQYWDFDFQEPEKKLSEEEYVEELDRLFAQAVNRQLVSDVEIGAYLSGGIDSGSITALAAKNLPYIKSFTCGFDLNSASGLELGYDERDKAEYMSYLFKTEHYEMVLKSGDMERCMPELVRALETPRVGQSYPNFYISRLAGKFVKVALCGTGGDEIFGGYPWRYYRAAVNDNFEDYVDKYYHYWQRLIPNTEIQKVFSPIWADVNHVWTRDIFHDVFKKHEHKLTCPEDYVNHSLYFEAKTFLHGLLDVEDKLSMAHSLETRVPFLDNDLVDFGMRVPVSMKLEGLSEVARINENEPGNKAKKYFEKSHDGKNIVRKTMQRHIPPEITDGKKQGFSAPDASWFKGESIEFVKRALHNPKARIYECLDGAEVRALVEEHISGKTNRRLLVWSLLNFEYWLKEFQV